MAEKKFPKLCKRKWLNKGSASAYVIVEARVDELEYGKNKGGTEVIATVEVKDCNRQIALEFWYGDEKEYKERLAKIATLKSAIDELETFMLNNPPEKVGKKVERDASKKPSEPLSELLLTERHPDPPSLRGELTAPLRKPSIIEIGPVRLKHCVAIKETTNEATGS